MKVLVTGGLGYIGSHVVAEVSRLASKVVILDSLINSNKEILENLTKICNSELVLIESDIRQTESVEHVLIENQIDLVIHMAGLKSVGESIANPIAYFDNNVSGAISLLTAMQRARVKRLIFSSSATVYGTPEILPIDELHKTKSLNPYGRSKIQIEQILTDLASSDPGWQIICLRYFNPVGSHSSLLIGESPLIRPTNLMPLIVRVAAGEIPHLQIYGDDYSTRDGTCERDYIHVSDLAEGHVAALNALDSDEEGIDFINLGTGRSTSVLELLTCFSKTNEIAVPYECVARREGDAASCFASVDKAARVLRWRASRSLEDMCKTAWRYYRAASP